MPEFLSYNKPGETTTQRPSPFVPFLVLFGSPAMNWNHAVSWGRGVWVSVSDIGRVGQPELVVGQPELKKTENECLVVWLG